MGIFFSNNSELRKLLRLRCFRHFSQSAFSLRLASLGHWKRRLTQWWLSTKGGRREIILKQDGCQRTLLTSMYTMAANTETPFGSSSSSFPAKILKQPKFQ